MKNEMRKTESCKKLQTAIRILAIVLLMWGTLPISITLIAPNVDNSGMYLLNIANQLGLKFGTDLAFTYGPLGFLYATQNIGHNAQIALMFYGLLTLAEIWLAFCTFRRLHGRRGMVLICCSVVLFLSGVSLWTKDYYICFLVFLALSLAWTEVHPHRYLIFASVVTVVLALIKFNTGIQCVVTLVLFVLGKLILERHHALRYLPYLPAIAATYITAFLIYNPSFAALGHYLSTNIEISSGYSTAMSLVPEPRKLAAAILCGGCFCVLIVIVFLADRESGFYLLMFSGALFQIFKHGYVRADAHIYIFFMGFLMIITVITLFLNYDRLLPALKSKHGMAVCSCLMAVVTLAVPVYALHTSLQNLSQVFPDKLNDLLYGISSRMETRITPSNEDILPDRMLKIIGNETVAVLPWELSIGAYNNINMDVMPSMQSLMAYTPDLDEENAAFFTGSSAPKYVVFAFYAIDGRLPLLETPATWQAIYENYTAVLQDGIYLLLEKNDTPYIMKLGTPDTQVDSSNAQIKLPDTGGETYVRMDAELNLWGKLNKLFYQVSPVTITLFCDDGSTINGRVLPEVLKNGIVLSDLPNSLQSTGLVMNGQPSAKKIVSFCLGGDGWKYYKATMTVHFQKVLSQKETLEYSPYKEIKVQPVENPTYKLRATKKPGIFWVDSVNGTSIKASMTTKREAGFYLSGWALDNLTKNAPKAVYLKFGDRYYQLRQTERPDVSKVYLGNTNHSRCGYAGWVSLVDSPPGKYPVSLVVICEDGASYYESAIGSMSVEP